MPIQVLPPQLANQIAAGEVVERPASVVKELLENSLDAGSTKIDIDIERGGSRLIRIRDNGCGIAKAELALALARHATSKIASLEDLQAINSLGFRGEALASISSVARLTMTSRPAEQEEAWQVYAEGREMNAIIKPAAHPIGTTIEVLDLFYNTPARRKFLRTDKTEFGHIDEVVRRIALARFDVAITLNHNGKVVRQYRVAADQPEARERRLAAICGSNFLQHALAITWQHAGLAVEGWVVEPEGLDLVGESQYCYVNGRIVRDRLLSHAIRQAYQGQIGDERQPAYVLYLQLDPEQIDVNVHPAKHEVRFHQSRLVHDFIYQAVLSVLQQAKLPDTALTTSMLDDVAQQHTRVSAGKNIFATPELQTPDIGLSQQSLPQKFLSQQFSSQQIRPSGVRQQKPSMALYQQVLNSAAHETQATYQAKPVFTDEPAITGFSGEMAGFGRVLAIVEDSFVVVLYQQQLALLSLVKAEQLLRQAQLTPDTDGLRPQPLLIPLQLNLDQSPVKICQQHQALLESLAILLQPEKKRVLVMAVPVPLRQQNLQCLIPEMLVYLGENPQLDIGAMVVWLAQRLKSSYSSWNHAQAIQLLAELERLDPRWVKNPPVDLLQRIDLQATLSMLQA